MSECENNSHSPGPYHIFQTCTFREEPKTITRGGRADILCGTFDVMQPPQMIAVKAFRCRADSPEDSERSIESELKIWRILCAPGHLHIASFIGAAPVHEYSSGYFPKGLVSNYYANGNLNEFLGHKDPDCSNYAMRLQLLIGVIRGLEHVHATSIVHGDLKADNVLVDTETYLAKICDFGSSSIDCQCYIGPRYQAGTTSWDSPELWQTAEGRRNQESDMWAFGCVALEVQMGMTPWDPSGQGNIIEMRRRQLRARGGYPMNESDLDLAQSPVLGQVWDLMKECWRKEPMQRTTSASLKKKLENMTPVIAEPGSP